MKKILVVLSILLFNVLSLSAQCIITKKDGSTVKGNVLEVDNSVVKFRYSDEPNARIYTLRKDDVLMITDEDGNVDVISVMKYKDLKGLYNYRKWTKSEYDQYSPGLMGFCSFLVPGLGQMLCGEGGRGAGWLVGALGSAAVAGAGMGMYKAYSNDHSLNTGYYGVGLYMMILGSVTFLTIDLCAVADACRVAKVKNLYEQAWRKPSYSFELHPSVDYVRMADGYQPTAGFSLALKF